MKTNKKEKYLSPEAEVFEVKSEGAICTGSGTLQDYNWNEYTIE